MSLRLPKPEKRAKAPKPIRRSCRPRRESRRDLSKAHRALWKLFAAYVKERDGATCISCSAVGLVGKNWQAGHLFSSDKFPAIRYHYMNVHSQCSSCNCWLGGNGAPYSRQFIERYGIDQFNLLDSMKRQDKQWRAPELEELMAALKKGGADFELLYAEKYGAFFMPSALEPNAKS